MNESARQGERAAVSRGIILGPGEGRTIPGTDAMTLKATSVETGGSIGFLEATSPPGAGPPRHIHHSHDELFYVLEGEVPVGWPARSSSCLGARSTPLRLSEASPARCWRPTYRGLGAVLRGVRPVVDRTERRRGTEHEPRQNCSGDK